MTLTPVLVLDANILIRAVLGRRVRGIIETYAEQVRFFTPDVCVGSVENTCLILPNAGDGLPMRR